MDHGSNFSFWNALKTTTAITAFDINFLVVGFLLITAFNMIKSMDYIKKNIAEKKGFKIEFKTTDPGEFILQMIYINIVSILPSICFIIIMLLYFGVKIIIFY